LKRFVNTSYSLKYSACEQSIQLGSQDFTLRHQIQNKFIQTFSQPLL
jgi:hypothetical protein